MHAPYAGLATPAAEKGGVSPVPSGPLEHQVPCQSTGSVHEGESSREDIRKVGDRALVSHGSCAPRQAGMGTQQAGKSSCCCPSVGRSRTGSPTLSPLLQHREGGGGGRVPGQGGTGWARSETCRALRKPRTRPQGTKCIVSLLRITVGFDLCTGFPHTT